MNDTYEWVRIIHSIEVELLSKLISVASLQENQSIEKKSSKQSFSFRENPTSIKCVRCFRSSSNRNQVASNPAPKLTIYIESEECQ